MFEPRKGPVLVTAFEPFTTADGRVLDTNPTEAVVNALALQRNVAIAVLPCSFARTRRVLLQLFAEHAPRAWIGLGVAMSRATIDIETVAKNIEHARGFDNDRQSPTDREIIADAPLAYRTGLAAAELAGRLDHAGFPVRQSFDAGTFLCNQAFYLGCHAAHTTGVPGLAAFVHIPPIDPAEVNAVPIATTVSAIAAILDHIPQ